MRRSRLSRTGNRRVALPPREQLRAEARILRQIAPDDPKVIAVANAYLATDEMLAAGYTVRRGGPDEPKRAEPLPEWKKPPPETP